MAMRALLVSLLPGLAAAACAGTHVRVGTFGDSNPEALIIISDWLNSNKVTNECWTFYRQSSGIYSIQKLDSGDLDMALLGSTPYAAARNACPEKGASSCSHSYLRVVCEREDSRSYDYLFRN